jgi:hypothetical protein
MFPRSPFFRRNVSPPFSRTRNKPSKKSAGRATSFMFVSCLVYSSTLKMKATCSSETPTEFQRTARRYIPRDRTLSNTFVREQNPNLGALFYCEVTGILESVFVLKSVSKPDRSKRRHYQTHTHTQTIFQPRR